MITDKDIIFLTTTIYSPCLELQQRLIRKFFPESRHILIDGTDKLNWPNLMFNWINELKSCHETYFILIDEDCFIVNREEIIKTIELLENDIYDIIGCPDGYHPFRVCNPIVLNPFILFGRVEDMKSKIELNFSTLKYKIKKLDYTRFGDHYQWENSASLKYKHNYRDSFFYPHPILSDSKFQDGKEPYYCFNWYLKEKEFRFGYLFPYMNKELIATTPKINQNSSEMAIHMWESRNMNSREKLFGKTAFERFELVNFKLLNFLK